MSKTVNFIEAVNSGKRFSPDYSPAWFTLEDVKRLELDGITYGEFINSQFELEEKTITITEGEFDEALKNFFKDAPFPCQTKLKKELGF